MLNYIQVRLREERKKKKRLVRFFGSHISFLAIIMRFSVIIMIIIHDLRDFLRIELALWGMTEWKKRENA